MGTKWEVSAYVKYQVDPPDQGIDYMYKYETVLMTQSLLKAILAMRKARKTSGCVKLEWRG